MTELNEELASMIAEIEALRVAMSRVIAELSIRYSDPETYIRKVFAVPAATEKPGSEGDAARAFNRIQRELEEAAVSFALGSEPHVQPKQ